MNEEWLPDEAFYLHAWVQGRGGVLEYRLEVASLLSATLYRWAIESRALEVDAPILDGEELQDEMSQGCLTAAAPSDQAQNLMRH